MIDAGESYTYTYVDMYNKEPFIDKYKQIEGYVVTPYLDQMLPRHRGFVRLVAVPPYVFPDLTKLYSAEVSELIPAVEVLM